MRRPPHWESVARSAGVAEHRTRRTLSQPPLTRLFAVAVVSALVLVPSGAHATTTKDKIAQVRAQIDAVAQRWFQAQNHAAQLAQQISDAEHAIHDAQARVFVTRAVAMARAVMLYKTSNVELSPVFGNDPLDSARRAKLADQANANSEDAIGQLTAAMQDLQSQRSTLEKDRTQQQKVLRQVAQERAALDAQLASLRAQAQHEAAAALAAARSAAARAQAQARLRAFVQLAAGGNSRGGGNSAPAATAAPVALPAAPAAPPAAPPPPDPAPVFSAPAPAGGGGSSHHSDPFLVCTRARESSGNYSTNTGNGYYGAYQFLPATWDSVAVHIGRMDLVGVLPSAASPADQDTIAWALYQWQGKGPWGGRC